MTSSTPLLSDVGRPNSADDEISVDHTADASRASGSTATTCPHIQIDPILGLLFAGNGLALTLPINSFMAILNDRVQMPVSMLPIYAGLAFAPFGLKPIYVTLTQQALRYCSVATLMPMLYIGGAIMMMASASISSVSSCLLVGFFRGVTLAWPELVLSITLVDSVERHTLPDGSSSFLSSAALLQSQAATARNMGSWLGSIVVLLVFLPSPNGDSTSTTVVTFLLGASALVQLVAACLSGWYYRRREQCSLVNAFLDEATLLDSTTNTDEEAVASEDSEAVSVGTSSSPSQGQRTLPWTLQVQGALILFIFKDSLRELVSNVLFYSVCGISLVGCAALLCWWLWDNRQKPFSQTCRASLFLLLRQARPRVTSVILSSFVYSHCSAELYAWLSIWDGAMISGASALFGLFSTQLTWRKTIVSTTLFNSAATTLAASYLVKAVGGTHSMRSIIIVFLVKAVLVVADELQFLPHVVLAMTVSSSQERSSSTGINADDHDAPATHTGTSGISMGARYGSLLAFMDLGSQMGSLVVGPMVRVLGTTRANDWEHLVPLLQLAALVDIATIALLVLRPDKR